MLVHLIHVLYTCCFYEIKSDIDLYIGENHFNISFLVIIVMRSAYFYVLFYALLTLSYWCIDYIKASTDDVILLIVQIHEFISSYKDLVWSTLA